MSGAGWYLFLALNRTFRPLLVVVILSIVTFVVVLSFFWVPRHEKVVDAKNRLNIVLHEGELARNYRQLDTLYLRAKKLEQEFDTHVAEYHGQIGWADEFVKAAQTDLVNLESLSFQEKQEGKASISRLEATVKVSGKFQDIRRWLAGLSRMRTLTIIDQIRIARAIGNDGAVEVFLVLSTYYTKQGS